MKQGWEIKKLGEVCEIKNGRNQSDVVNPDGQYPIYGSGGIMGYADDYICNEGCTIIGRKGSINNPIYVTTKFWNVDTAFGFSPLAELDGRFLYYFCLGFNFKNLDKGTTLPSLTKTDLSLIEIPFPPLTEQQRIVKKLDKLFTDIVKAKDIAEQNLKNSKELFNSYLQGVFEKKGDDWEEKTLNQISDNLDSRRVPITKNIRDEGLIPYYGASGIVDYVSNYLFNEDLLCISEDGANLIARTYPIAFSISGKTWVNNHAHVLRFNNIVSQRLVEFYLNSIKLDEFISGMAQPKLNQAMLNKIPIPFPSLSEQQIIVQKLDTLSVETKRLEAIYQQKLLNMEELKKSVLQKAFNGELNTTKEVAV